jgi:hypothetical protein
MLAYTNKALKKFKPTKHLLLEDLESIFSPEQIRGSTYTNKLGKYVRLINSNPTQAKVPALYNYNRVYIEKLQSTYLNITPFGSESALTSNRKLDMIINSIRSCYSETDLTNPPLPCDQTLVSEGTTNANIS